MKKIIVVLCLFCLVSSANAQISWADSLKNLLSSAKDDTTKLNLLSTLVVKYTWSMPDSALTYVQREISLARKMKSDYALSLALTGYGGVLSIMGNYAQAIHFELEGLKAAERSKDFQRIFWSYYYLAMTYRDAGDYEHALFYCYKKKSVLDSRYKLSLDSTEKTAIKTLYNSYVIFDFAVIYDKLNQPDSALKYIQTGNQAAIRQYGKIDSPPTYLYLLGNIYSGKGDYFRALEYYRRGYRYAVDNHINSNIMENSNGLAKIFGRRISRIQVFIMPTKFLRQAGMHNILLLTLKLLVCWLMCINQRAILTVQLNIWSSLSQQKTACLVSKRSFKCKV